MTTHHIIVGKSAQRIGVVFLLPLPLTFLTAFIIRKFLAVPLAAHHGMQPPIWPYFIGLGIAGIAALAAFLIGIFTRPTDN